MKLSTAGYIGFFASIPLGIFTGFPAVGVLMFLVAFVAVIAGEIHEGNGKLVATVLLTAAATGILLYMRNR